LSYSNDIRKLLDIQDSNITFGENFIQEGQYKGKPCKYITAKLTYNPTQPDAKNATLKIRTTQFIKTGHNYHGSRCQSQAYKRLIYAYKSSVSSVQPARIVLLQKHPL